MTHSDIYADVTRRLVESIEAGTSPWSMPWVGGYPINVRTGRAYRGVNVFMLGLISSAKGYSDPRWGTYKAISEMGGQVRKGERSSQIVLWKPVKGKATESSDGEQAPAYMLLRSYAVFNSCQADGLPAMTLEFEHDPIERAEEIVRSYVPIGPLIQFGGGSAHYEPARDIVACPGLSQFKRVEGYYSTLYHELVHSTGHESRLDRLIRNGFGSGPYAKEELVAEMGAAMLCGMAGIDNLDQSAAYLKGWLKPLSEDPKFAVQAAAQAQKAAYLILGVSFDSQETENQQMAVAA